MGFGGSGFSGNSPTPNAGTGTNAIIAALEARIEALENTQFRTIRLQANNDTNINNTSWEAISWSVSGNSFIDILAGFAVSGETITWPAGTLFLTVTASTDSNDDRTNMNWQIEKDTTSYRESGGSFYARGHTATTSRDHNRTNSTIVDAIQSATPFNLRILLQREAEAGTVALLGAETTLTALFRPA